MRNLVVVKKLASTLGENESRKILKMLYRTEGKHPITREYIPDDISILCFLGKDLSDKAENLRKLAIDECEIVLSEAIQAKKDPKAIEGLKKAKKAILIQYLRISHIGEILDTASQVIMAKEAV